LDLQINDRLVRIRNQKAENYYRLENIINGLILAFIQIFI